MLIYKVLFLKDNKQNLIKMSVILNILNNKNKIGG